MNRNGIVILAADAPERALRSNYPEPFASRMAGRIKKPLGDLFGLRNFGVNLTTLRPGSVSALQHRHSQQDEFVFLLDGSLTLFTDRGKEILSAGMCAGFPANGTAHHLFNHTDADATYIEIGDRSPGDGVTYPDDDLQAVKAEDGRWHFAHKDGRPY